MPKRSLLLSVGVVLMGSVCAPALDFMGPPTSGLDFGKWGAGVTYFTSEEDVEFEGTTLDDFETSRYAGWIGYGLSDWWEVYTRLGGIRVEADSLGFDAADFFGTLGTKVTFARSECLDWGFLIQSSWSELEDDYSFDLSEFGLGAQQFDMDIDLCELQAAVGPVLKLDGLKIYGGPFFYCLDGDVEIGLGGNEADFDLEEKTSFGGYAGVIVDLGTSAALVAEAMFTGDGWGAGASIGWEF